MYQITINFHFVLPHFFYIKNTKYINNWDLVDLTAPNILGDYLLTRDRRVLYKLTKSKNIWERRIAMVATHAWIARGDTADAYAIADLLLDDPHDLIRKAVGWMLREAGVHDRAALLRFLRTRYTRVARTTLRYAIEHLPAAQRKRILAGDFA